MEGAADSANGAGKRGMKKNRNFSGSKTLWPFGILLLMILGVVWSNVTTIRLPGASSTPVAGRAPAPGTPTNNAPATGNPPQPNSAVAAATVNPNGNTAQPNTKALKPAAPVNGTLNSAPTVIKPPAAGALVAGATAAGTTANNGRTTAAATALSVQTEISEIVAAARPGVVGIIRKWNGRAPRLNNGLGYLEPYAAGNAVEGAGFIVHRDGYVITTARTVGRAATVTVNLSTGGGKSLAADVVGSDPASDMVLLKIRLPGVYPVLAMGNSDLTQPGEIVFAMGNPFGFSGTVTMGIISGKRRDTVIGGNTYPRMLQTDAAVNSGNDGGPLINIKGEVVGVNIAGFMPDNRFSGMGFALPANDAAAFLRTATAGKLP